MAGIRTRAELKGVAKQQLSGNWGKAILVWVIMAVIFGVIGAIKIVGPIIIFLLEGGFMLGLVGFFLDLARQKNVRVGQLFDGFARYGSSLLLVFLNGLFVFLWSLLLVIPGIVAALSYSMAFYIMRDQPGISAMEALRQSKQMMKGHRWRYFVLGLSFIGWYLLSIITCGIGLLWLVPYVYATQVNFYENLREAQPAV